MPLRTIYTNGRKVPVSIVTMATEATATVTAKTKGSAVPKKLGFWATHKNSIHIAYWVGYFPHFVLFTVCGISFEVSKYPPSPCGTQSGEEIMLGGLYSLGATFVGFLEGAILAAFYPFYLVAGVGTFLFFEYNKESKK